MSGTAIHDALRGVKAALPFWLGFFPLGFILGAQACHKGMSVPTAAAMSFFNYAGGSEFAAVALWTATPPLLLIAFTTWLINSRHIHQKTFHRQKSLCFLPHVRRSVGREHAGNLKEKSRGRSGRRMFLLRLSCRHGTWLLVAMDMLDRTGCLYGRHAGRPQPMGLFDGLSRYLHHAHRTDVAGIQKCASSDGKRYRFGRLQFLDSIALVRPFGNADGARACSLSASAFRKPSRLRNSYGNTDCRYLVSA